MRRRRRPSTPFDTDPYPGGQPEPAPAQQHGAPPPQAEDALVEDVDERPIVREGGRAAERDARLLSDDEHLRESGLVSGEPSGEERKEGAGREHDSLESLIDSLVADEEASGEAGPVVGPAAGAQPGQWPHGTPQANPADASPRPQAPGAGRPQAQDALQTQGEAAVPGPAPPAEPRTREEPQPRAAAAQQEPAVTRPQAAAEGHGFAGQQQPRPEEGPTFADRPADPSLLEGIELGGEDDDPSEIPGEEHRPEPFVSELERDQDLWSRIFSDEGEAAEQKAPEPPSLDFGEEGEEAEPAAEEAPEGQPAPAGGEEPGARAREPQPEEAAASPPARDGEQEAQRPYMAVRTASLDGPNPLPLALDFENDVDEVNHALAAFSDLEHGQVGLIRFSLRAYPEFKQKSREWLVARRTGADPEPKDLKHKVVAWARYLFSRLWFEIMRKPGDKTPPPLKPGERGTKVKPASEFTTEEKESWKAAERKAADTAHFEVVLRVGVVGPPEEAERQVEEVAAGFEAFSTPYQLITWRPGDPYAALLGLMPARRPDEVPMALSAEEIAGMAHVPDDQTVPHGVRVKRSYFKQLPPPNPITIDDRMNPPKGLIPIGEINPDSEDAKVIAMNNAQLDQHAVVVGKTGSGKALALDTPIPTPQGMRTMGDLRPGDYVFGADGRPTRVLGVTEVMEGRPCYEVVFSDGERIVADANHIWVTRDAAARRCGPALRCRGPKPPSGWLGAVERLERGEGLVSERDAVRAGVPLGAVREAARRVPPARLEVRASRRARGGAVVLERARLLPLYERAELCRALRRRACGSRRQWERGPAPRERTTAELAASVLTADGRANHSIDPPEPLRCPERELPVEPYTLGAWLGAGHSRRGQITTADPEVADAIRAEGYEAQPAGKRQGRARAYAIRGLGPRLRELGLLAPGGEKRIPEEYFTASARQRWALLEGLLDTGGGVERGACRLRSESRALAEDVRRLAFTLGLHPSLSEKPARLEGRDRGPSYSVSFACPRKVFRVERKRRAQRTEVRVPPRYIVDVRPVPSVPVRCIQVAAEDGMYLAGRSCVPTHNSVFLTWLVFGVAKADYPIVVVDPHGPLSDDILKILLVNCPERVEDIVLCDLSDDEYPVAFNPLDIHNRHEITATVNSVAEMLSSLMHLDSAGAPRATLFAKQALTALCFANLVLEDPETKCTLLDVIPFFQNEQFRRLIVEFCDNPVVRQNFDPEDGVFEMTADKEKTNISMPIIRAFSQLGEDDSFSAVFSSPQNKLNLGKLVDQGKIVIIKLARFQNQAKLGEFVGSLILPWMLSSMDSWGRKKDPITGELVGRGARIFVDEAPTLYGPESSVPKALAEARKWDLGLISIGQNLGQFPKNVAEALLANTASKFALASDPNVSGQIAKAVAGASSLITPADIAQLPNYHMYANVLLPAPGGGVAASGPFSARCLPPMNDELTEEHLRLREEVIARSRELMTNPISKIRGLLHSHLDNIMRNLHQKLQERIEAGYDRPSQNVTSGGGVEFDPDQGWV